MPTTIKFVPIAKNTVIPVTISEADEAQISTAIEILENTGEELSCVLQGKSYSIPKDKVVFKSSLIKMLKKFKKSSSSTISILVKKENNIPIKEEVSNNSTFSIIHSQSKNKPHLNKIINISSVSGPGVFIFNKKPLTDVTSICINYRSDHENFKSNEEIKKYILENFINSTFFNSVKIMVALSCNKAIVTTSNSLSNIEFRERFDIDISKHYLSIAKNISKGVCSGEDKVKYRHEISKYVNDIFKSSSVTNEEVLENCRAIRDLIKIEY